MGTFALAGILLLTFAALRLSRLLEKRAPRPERDGAAAVVPLNSRNAHVAATDRFCLALLLAGGCLSVAVAIAGNASSAIGIALLGLLPPLFAWNLRLSHSGMIDIHDDALVIRVNNATHEYPWRDIKALERRTWRESGRIERAWIRVTGADAQETFVHLRLRRTVGMAVGLWKTRYGTEVAGLPIPIRQLKLFPEDAERFLALAQPYVDAAARRVA